jgi:hypothetical protein
MVIARGMLAWWRVGCGLVVLLACLALPACENSILRNAGEAGLETILDRPTPTVRAGAAATPPR